MKMYHLFAIFLNDFEYTMNRYYNDCEMSDDDAEVCVRLIVLTYADDTVVLSDSETKL